MITQQAIGVPEANNSAHDSSINYFFLTGNGVPTLSLTSLVHFTITIMATTFTQTPE